jgi:hypothetical protein
VIFANKELRPSFASKDLLVRRYFANKEQRRSFANKEQRRSFAPFDDRTREGYFHTLS